MLETKKNKGMHEDGGSGSPDSAPDRPAGSRLEPPATIADPDPPPSPEEVEARLGLDRRSQRLIQLGLAAAGFDPGTAGGLFGAGAREALRQWQSARGVAVTGYLTQSAALELLAAEAEAARQAEAEAARQMETEAARQAALAARAAEAARAAPPSAEEVEAEAGLGLDDGSRRLIELGLSSLGFEPGLVDGVFGQTARRALREWQGSRRESATGYLDAGSASVLRSVGNDPRRGTLFKECIECPQMVVVPSGTFTMGSAASYVVDASEGTAASRGNTGAGCGRCLRGDAGRVCAVRVGDRARGGEFLSDLDRDGLGIDCRPRVAGSRVRSG